MKTKIARLTVTLFAAVALAPLAFAAPEYGPKPSRRTATQAAPTCCMSAPCKGKDCCTTKLVMTGYTGNHNQVPTYKRVIDCKGNCPVVVDDQKAACSKGSRA